MGEILNQNNLNETYEPYMAIVLYKTPSNHYHGNAVYIEQHKITDGAMQEGKPLTESTVRDLAKKFTNTIKQEKPLVSKGMLQQLLFADQVNNVYIWYNAPQQRELHFHKSLKLKNGIAWMPALLFRYGRGGLDVFALGGEDRPIEGTELYRAPFHNTNSSGDVCMGTAGIKLKNPQYFEDIIAACEGAFFNSNFTHITGSESPTKSNINVVWKTLIDSPKKKFPVTELKSCNKVLEDLLPNSKKKKR